MICWRFLTTACRPLRATDFVVRSGRLNTAIKQALLERVATCGARARHDRLLEHVRYSDRPTRSGRSRLSAARLGTHFSILRVLCGCSNSSPRRDRSSVVERITRFADLHLGKGVVIAKDRRISSRTTSVFTRRCRFFEFLASGEHTIEEIDEITRRCSQAEERRSARSISPASTFRDCGGQRRSGSAALRAISRRTRLDRREVRAGFLQETYGGLWRIRDPRD